MQNKHEWVKFWYKLTFLFKGSFDPPADPELIPALLIIMPGLMYHSTLAKIEICLFPIHSTWSLILHGTIKASLCKYYHYFL